MGGLDAAFNGGMVAQPRVPQAIDDDVTSPALHNLFCVYPKQLERHPVTALTLLAHKSTQASRCCREWGNQVPTTVARIVEGSGPLAPAVVDLDDPNLWRVMIPAAVAAGSEVYNRGDPLKKCPGTVSRKASLPQHAQQDASYARIGYNGVQRMCKKASDTNPLE